MLITDIAATSYSAGPAVRDALNVSRRFAGMGIASTLCYWNDLHDSSSTICDAYLQLIDGLRGGVNRSTADYLSMKLPALAFDDDLLNRVLDRASAQSVGVHFDSLAYEEADRTFIALERARRRYAQFGCTLPGRWRRSLSDAEFASALGVRVRVVKGEWPDTMHPQTDARAGFMEVIDRLSGRARLVCVATHDVELACQAIRRLKTAGTPCELEFLFGRPMRSIVRLGDLFGIPVRAYVPCGRAWLPYRLKLIHRQPRIAAFFLHDLVRGIAHLTQRSRTLKHPDYNSIP